MPITKSAKKKLRQDKKRTRHHDRMRTAYKSAATSAQEKPTKKSVARAQSMIDKAAKRNIIHANKAARLKKQVTRHA